MLSKRVFSNYLSFLKTEIHTIRSRSTTALQTKEKENSKSEKWENALPFHKIPGPTILPLIGTRWLSFLPVKAGGYDIRYKDSSTLKMFKEYGPIVRIENFYGDVNIVLIYDPHNIEKIYRNEGIAPDRFSHSALEYYKSVVKKDFFRNIGGIVAVDAEKWLKFRPKINVDMLQPKIVNSYLNPIENVAKKFIKRIDLIIDHHNEVPPDFVNEIAKWVLESLSTFVLGVEMGCLDPIPDREVQEFIEATLVFEVALIEMDFSPPVWKHLYTPTWIKFEKALDTMLNTVIKHVKLAKTKNSEYLSIFERLLMRHADNPKIALIAAFELFITGVETMKSTASSVLYQLSKHPEIQAKLYQEIIQIAPSYDTPLTNANIENMHYLKAFIKEMLRVAPPIPVNSRIVMKDSVIHGYQVPQGTNVIFDVFALQTSEQYFKNAQKFEPERWLRTNKDVEERHPFSTLPFSFGKRSCVGRRFANLQLYTLTCKMLQKYKIKYMHEDLEYYSSPFICLNGDLKFKFIER